MARARNIKPGFFKNEELGAIPMGARLLFVGMWTLADREGRLEDRPARIAAEVFPYDREICVSTVSTWIDALAGFVTRYTANGGKY
ncbi:MAG: phage replication protein, partial [Planctomycetota bacterium]|nr:phage replication protein [Planctomycetota bacterium]